jgi:hypothetical protein
MNSRAFRKSDRERVGLHGSVKTFAEPWSITEFDENGMIVFWRGNICGGTKSDRQYFYDDAGQILRIQGSTDDHTDNFQYEHGRKICIRNVPVRRERERVGFSVNVIFDSTEEGEVLSEGGTITTVFNEWDERAESEVRDPEGHLFSRVMHEYNDSGQLVKEVLVRELSEFTFPKKFRDHIPPEQREAAFAQIRAELQKSYLFGEVERSYIYNEQNRVAECHMQMGGYVQNLSYEYNEHGDTSQMILHMNCSSAPSAGYEEQYLEIRYYYAYDEHGNWTEQTTSSRVGGEERSNNSQRRHFLYY